MWLHKRIEEKGCEVGKVYPLARSFLVSISSRVLVWLSRPIHLLSVHFSRFDMLTPHWGGPYITEGAGSKACAGSSFHPDSTSTAGPTSVVRSSAPENFSPTSKPKFPT